MAVKSYPKGSKEWVAPNFRVPEFACHGEGCCQQVWIDEQLVAILQKIRDHFGKAVRITSGYRCEKHNKAVGGAAASRHTKGQAADITVSGIQPAQVAAFAESIGVLGIGLYETDRDGYFVHIDTRTKKSFWYGQKEEKRETFLPREKVCTLELPVLSKGSKGGTVKAAQQLLAGFGYGCGDAGVDGIFGKDTQKALEDFQQDQTLPRTGRVEEMTWKSLLGIQ